MTAKSRVRKIQKRIRRSNDVNPQPGSPRSAASAEEGSFNLSAAVVLDGQARLRSVSLVREGTGAPGYVIEVGELGSSEHPDLTVEEQLLYDIFSGGPEEALREEAASDAAPLAERGSSGTAEATLVDWDIDRNQPARIPTHQVFFEAEVNGQPTDIGVEDCYCGLDSHHWKDLGEN